MTLLIAGLLIFFAIHLLPSFPELRNRLREQLGALAYRGVFSLIALAGFVLIVMGKGRAEFVSIWIPPAELAVATKILMLPAMVFLVAAYVPSNIKRRVRHPMLTAVKIWALGHLLSNGDLASILLFGSFLAYAVFDMVSANRRSEAPVLAQQPLFLDILVLVLGGVAYALIGWFHMDLFGVAIH